MEQPSENASLNLEDNYVLWRLLDHTRFMISRLREKELDEFGLTPEQVHILDILENHDGKATINIIVDITQRKHHSVSTQISRMAKQGLISRKRNPDDFRQYDISITRRGQTLLNRVTRDSFEKSFSVFSTQQKRELRNLLSVLLEQAYGLHGIERKSRFGGE